MRTIWPSLTLSIALLATACAPAALPEPEPTFTSIVEPSPVPTEAPSLMPAPTASPVPDGDTSSSSDGSDSSAVGPDLRQIDSAQVAPQPGEDAIAHGPVFLDSSEILVLESFPVQLRLHLIGSLPDPCHQLRVVVGAPDAQNGLSIEVYSVVLNEDLMCAQVLVPFEVSVPLEGLAPGTYQVRVNDQDLGQVTQ